MRRTFTAPAAVSLTACEIGVEDITLGDDTLTPAVAFPLADGARA